MTRPRRCGGVDRPLSPAAAEARGRRQMGGSLCPHRVSDAADGRPHSRSDGPTSSSPFALPRPDPHRRRSARHAGACRRLLRARHRAHRRRGCDRAGRAVVRVPRGPDGPRPADVVDPLSGPRHGQAAGRPRRRPVDEPSYRRPVGGAAGLPLPPDRRPRRGPGRAPGLRARHGGHGRVPVHGRHGDHGRARLPPSRRRAGGDDGRADHRDPANRRITGACHRPRSRGLGGPAPPSPPDGRGRGGRPGAHGPWTGACRPRGGHGPARRPTSATATSRSTPSTGRSCAWARSVATTKSSRASTGRSASSVGSCAPASPSWSPMSPSTPTTPRPMPTCAARSASRSRSMARCSASSTSKAPRTRRSSQGDLDTMIVVGDRVAAALALGRERQALQERADLFGRLARFGSAINASLDPVTAHESIIVAVSDVLEVDITTLILRDQATGEDRIVAIRGGDERYVGASIPPGEGTAGKALAEGRVVNQDQINREEFPATLRGARVPDVLVGASFPLLRDDVVIGAMAVTRLDLSRTFTPLELEMMPLIASQIALALNNVELHARDGRGRRPRPADGPLEPASPRCRAGPAVRGAGAVRPGAAPPGRRDPVRPRPLRAVQQAPRPPDRRRRPSRVRLDPHPAPAFERPRGALRGRGVPGRARRRQPGRGPARGRGDPARARSGRDPGIGRRGAARHGLGRLRVARPERGLARGLLEVADVGLQMAKRGGRNQVVAA